MSGSLFHTDLFFNSKQKKVKLIKEVVTRKMNYEIFKFFKTSTVHDKNRGLVSTYHVFNR